MEVAFHFFWVALLAHLIGFELTPAWLALYGVGSLIFAAAQLLWRTA